MWALTVNEISRDPSVLLSASKKDLEKIAGSMDSKTAGKLRNFASVRDRLEDCFKNNSDKRGLKQALMSGALTNPCIAKGFGWDSLQQMSFDLSSIATAATFSAAKSTIQNRTLNNAAKSIFEYRSRYEGSKPMPDDAASLDKMANEVCKGCSQQQKDYFKSAFNKHKAAAGNVPKSYSMESLAQIQNQTIEGLNRSLAKMEEAKNAKDEAAFDAAYEKYLNDYQRFTATPGGALFITDRMREMVGRVVTPEDASKKFFIAGKVSFPKHKPLDTQMTCARATSCSPRSNMQIRMGLQEIESKVGDFTKKVIEAENFEDLLKSDPALAGQILVVNPGLLGEVCSAAQNVMTSDARNQKILDGVDGFVGALDVASMGLMFAGGAGVLTKGVSAVVKLGATAARSQLSSQIRSSAGRSALASSVGSSRVFNITASQLMSRTAVVGAVSELGHLTSAGTRLSELSGMSDTMVASRLAMATSEVEMKRLAEIETQWNEAMSNLVTGTATNAIPLAHGLMKIRSTPLMRSLFKSKNGLMDQLDGEKKFLNLLSGLNKSELQKMVDAVDKNKLNSEQMAAALAIASNSEKGLANLKEGLKKNPEQFIKDLVAAAEGAQQCSI
ncbi:MAG: hypothetical protein ACK5W9_01755 [Bdellovibrionales bacterium]